MTNIISKKLQHMWMARLLSRIVQHTTPRTPPRPNIRLNYIQLTLPFR